MTRCVTSELARWLGRLGRCARGGVVAAGALLSVAQAAEGPPPVQVVFWTAGDCTWCKVWKTGDRHREFQAEADRLGVRLVTVAKPSLRNPDSDYRWPDEAERTPAAPARPVAPTMLPGFDFLCNGKQVRRLTGLAEWDSFWRSQVRQMARSCTTAPRS